ncbi:Thioesterase-like superfamily domain containing protein [Rhypophila decipiens]
MASTTINEVPKGVVPFSEAVKITRLDSHTYAANISQSFLIGTVPNGGYSSSLILQAASMHLPTQPDFLTSHFEFLNRTEAGPAIIVIEDVKLGRQLSTIHATLYQGPQFQTSPLWIPPPSSKQRQKAAKIAGYLIMTDLSKEGGLSLHTGFTLGPSPPPPRPDFAALENNTDGDKNWKLMTFPADNGFGRVRCLSNCVYYVPRRRQEAKSIFDGWVRLSCNENITDQALGYVVDCWPYIVEAYRPTSRKEEAVGEGDFKFGHGSVFWYPTCVMNIEVKKSLGRKGTRWLQMRVASKQIRNGRLDLEVILLDASGDLVALSSHVNLVLGGERNTAGRETNGRDGKL